MDSRAAYKLWLNHDTVNDWSHTIYESTSFFSLFLFLGTTLYINCREIKEKVEKKGKFLELDATYASSSFFFSLTAHNNVLDWRWEERKIRNLRAARISFSDLDQVSSYSFIIKLWDWSRSKENEIRALPHIRSRNFLILSPVPVSTLFYYFFSLKWNRR